MSRRHREFQQRPEAKAPDTAIAGPQQAEERSSSHVRVRVLRSILHGGMPWYEGDTLNMERAEAERRVERSEAEIV